MSATPPDMPDMPDMLDTMVLGASGYVAGELVRLLDGHPRLKLAAAFSESSAGQPVASAFPHLYPILKDTSFLSYREMPEALERSGGEVAVFSAANHGQSAQKVAEVLETASAKGVVAHVVDLSADFRYADADRYQEVYGKPHGAPQLLDKFCCGLPEHGEATAEHVGHPGCFTTSVLLAIVPLLKLGLVEPDLYVSSVTGSTGSGREPKPTTHHPLRQSNLFAYQALVHRHVPEMTAVAERASGVLPHLHFVPHSGPFSRGIHTTVQAKLSADLDEKVIAAELERFYETSPFVQVVSDTPRVKDVVGSNYAHLGVAAQEGSIAVFSVVDNLVKGAAGGGIQWMNRLIGEPDTVGLTAPAAGWL
jgi:N-acetyl-gamma-glutamyl-phosphate reductase common form